MTLFRDTVSCHYDGPLWVMMDDVIAGWLTALVVAILAAIAHLWLI